jgi:hypothetical protein
MLAFSQDVAHVLDEDVVRQFAHPHQQVFRKK